jgi:hypothetical protein
MPLPSTMTPIATTTLSSAANTTTFSNIPNTYTDLMLVINSANGSNDIDIYMQVNGDTASNYSWTALVGNGSTASSSRASSQSYARIGNMSGSNAGSNTTLVHFLNYSNTNTFKTMITRGNNAALLVESRVNLWRSTNAINSISVIGQFSISATLMAGSTITLYGIKAA